MQPQLRRTTILEREATRLLTSEDLEVGSTIVAKKRNIGENCGGGHVVLTTNVHGLLMRAVPMYRYDVGVYGYTRSEKLVEIAKKISSDALYVDRRANCRDIMTAFMNQHADFCQLASGNCLYYDLQSILYSLIPLDVDATNGHTFPVLMKSLNMFFSHIDIHIKAVPSGDIMLGDLSGATDDTSFLDKTLEQFLNIATSQQIMFNENEFVTFSSSLGFLLNPEAHGFYADDCPVFNDNGSYLGIGVRKGVRYVEGPRSNARHAAVVIEVKKTPFHNVEEAMAKGNRFVNDITTCQNGDVDRLAYYFKGLQMETTYGRLQKFTVTGVCRDSARAKHIMIGEGESAYEISILDYFAEKYNLHLRYPDMPLLEARGRKNQTIFFPMEMCRVSDNQRVTSRQQTPKQLQEMIKKCTVAPAKLREQNALITNALRLTNNRFLTACGIRFITNPLNVNARILAPPGLQYADGNLAQVRTDSFTWQGRHFIIPANINSWAAYAFNGGVRDSINDRDFCKFLDRFITEARNSGIKLPDPSDCRYPRSDTEVLKSELRLAGQNGVEFVLVAHPDSADDMHAALKMCERDFSIITQGLKIGTIRSVINKGQNLTVQNIVNKTNIKMGGLNYSLTMSSDIAKEVLGTSTLYIGFGMNHPAGGFGMVDNNISNGNGNGSDHNGNGTSSENSDLMDNKTPSVVGYAANIGKDKFEFIGDFLYQEQRRDEKVNLIRHVVHRCIVAYRNSQRKDPQRVIIYRNGCSEGQYSLILKYELPLIKSAVARAKCVAKVTVIVSNKLQSVRFFNTAIDAQVRPIDQNILPGTVVDNCVVHPKYCEFFLNSHRALQGTARTPKYTVLYDDNELTMDQLEGITYQLCYGHQIVFLPTSLPSPVYIAMRYAERGSLLYRRYKVVTSSDYEPRRYSELTDRLAYENVPALATRRVNA